MGGLFGLSDQTVQMSRWYEAKAETGVLVGIGERFRSRSDALPVD